MIRNLQTDFIACLSSIRKFEKQLPKSCIYWVAGIHRSYCNNWNAWIVLQLFVIQLKPHICCGLLQLFIDKICISFMRKIFGLCWLNLEGNGIFKSRFNCHSLDFENDELEGISLWPIRISEGSICRLSSTVQQCSWTLEFIIVCGFNRVSCFNSWIWQVLQSSSDVIWECMCWLKPSDLLLSL